MPLAFTRDMSPLDRRLFPVMLLGRRPGRRPLRRDWLRIADRLAVGMSPQAAALPEGGDAAMVEALLEREEFRGLVEAAEDDLAEPAEVARRRLVILARQTLERAMAWDDDPKAALFVLEEDARGRDPAETLAEACSQARARAVKAPPRPPPAPPSAAAPPLRPLLGYAPGYDPLQAMIGRGAARLRDLVRTEEAIRHAAEAAAEVEPLKPTDEPAPPAAALSAAPLSRDAALAAGYRELRHGLWCHPGNAELLALDPPAPEAGPRLAQAP